MELTAAILGKVPRFGLHIPENRGGEVLVELEREFSDAFSDVHFPVLGYMVGGITEDKIPVVDDLGEDPIKTIRTGDRVRVDGQSGMVEVIREV